MSSAHSSPNLWSQIASKKFVFLGVYTLVVFVTLLILNLFGFMPHGSRFGNAVLPSATSTAPIAYAPAGQGAVPLRIEIPKIGIQTDVNNPTNSDINTLDSALLTGAVRYPGSSRLGEQGNVLIFGHSSHLPVVHNQAYKAFNDIQNLVAGDVVYVLSTDKVYIYSVDTVEKANTTTGEISLVADGSRLTLATCDNFGTKADRFIVTASLVNVQPLEN